MADKIICPHCKGSGTNYVIATEDSKPSILSVGCAVCSGEGQVTPPEHPEPILAQVSEALPAKPELWPILIPLGLFSLFFVFLWA